MKNQVSGMDWKGRIVVDPEILLGKPTIKGTRMSVEFVIELLGGGATVTDILEEYGHVTAEDIQACLGYAGELLKSERIYVNPTEPPNSC